MIKCNLAVLLAERGLKMADVINDTSLSKTAVRGLYYNQSKGIQFETLQTLCDYLNVGPEDIIKNINFEYEIIKTIIDEDNFVILFEVLFKLEDKNMIDTIQISLLKPSVYEIFDNEDALLELDISYNDSLNKSILSQITSIESHKLDDFFIQNYIECLNLDNYQIGSVYIKIHKK